MNKISVNILLIGLILWSPPAFAEDLFARNRPDTGIAMIHFPQSLAVVQAVNDAGEIDSGLIKLWLRKMDPARLVPVKIGKNVQGEIDRDRLKALGDEYKTDLLLIFQSSIAGEQRITRGLVYFVKQEKINPLKTIAVQISNDPSEQAAALRTTLKHLVFRTRKTIHSYKFEERRSNY